MKLDNMFKKSQNISVNEQGNEPKSEVPEGLLRKCNMCKKIILAEEAENRYYICPKCGGYYHMPAMERIKMITDEGSFEDPKPDPIVSEAAAPGGKKPCYCGKVPAGCYCLFGLRRRTACDQGAGHFL